MIVLFFFPLKRYYIPMLEEIRAERLKKLALLRERGIDPYPATTTRTHTIVDAQRTFDTLSESGTVVTLAGRVLVTRGQGAIVFGDITDGTGKFQMVLKGDVLDAGVFELFKDVVDGGDFIEVTGTLFVTEKGQ